MNYNNDYYKKYTKYKSKYLQLKQIAGGNNNSLFQALIVIMYTQYKEDYDKITCFDKIQPINQPEKITVNGLKFMIIELMRKTNFKNIRFVENNNYFFQFVRERILEDKQFKTYYKKIFNNIKSPTDGDKYRAFNLYLDLINNSTLDGGIPEIIAFVQLFKCSVTIYYISDDNQENTKSYHYENQNLPYPVYRLSERVSFPNLKDFPVGMGRNKGSTGGCSTLKDFTNESIQMDTTFFESLGIAGKNLELNFKNNQYSMR